jgi:hypothetical protein
MQFKLDKIIVQVGDILESNAIRSSNSPDSQTLVISLQPQPSISHDSNAAASEFTSDKSNTLQIRYTVRLACFCLGVYKSRGHMTNIGRVSCAHLTAFVTAFI